MDNLPAPPAMKIFGTESGDIVCCCGGGAVVWVQGVGAIARGTEGEVGSIASKSGQIVESKGLIVQLERAQELTDRARSPITCAGKASLCRLDDGVMVQRIGTSPRFAVEFDESR